MNARIKCLCLLAAVLAVFGVARPSASGQAQEAGAARAKLADVRARIGALTERLGGELKQRDAASARVRAADLEITAERAKLERLRVAATAAERRRTELGAQRQRLQHTLEVERSVLAGEVRAAYEQGPQQELELLLNQHDPANVGRMAVFYGYFARQRLASLETITAGMKQAAALLVDIDQTTAQLEALEAEAARGLRELDRARTERVAALAALDRQLNSGTRQLSDLQRQAAAEEALIADLARVLQDFPVDSQRPFAELKGKLNWPVEPTAARAARTRGNGILIEAPRGAKVRAPYFGRVVYADWLQGLGLLLIIDHAGHYLTMYGRAEVLYKAVGDWVAPGDVIAGLADSAGAQPQLYFEIREGRTAEDARAWLKRAP